MGIADPGCQILQYEGGIGYDSQHAKEWLEKE